jgi:hypothetical protein
MITIKTSQNVARRVLQFLNSGAGMRTFNVEDQIDGHLKDIGLGWKLKQGTYIDGVDTTSISNLSRAIRANAVELNRSEIKPMTNEQIIELYDRKLNMTLAELSAITGKSIKDLKNILMGA